MRCVRIVFHLSATIAILSAVAILTNRPAEAQVNLISNPSFETPDRGSVPFTVLTAGTNIGGWIVGSGTVDQYTSAGWQAQNGNQSIDMSGDGPGSLFQDITTVPGQTYLLQFYMAGNPDPNPVVKSLAVSFGATSLPTQTFDVTGRSSNNMGWDLRTFSVQATGTTTRLTFTSLVAQSGGAAIDNVSVTAVSAPEPGTLAILLAGGIGFLPASRFLRRRRL